MNLSLRRVIALTAFSVATCASAEPQNVLTTIVEASEAPVKALVLPLSSTSSLVMTPCPGCAPKSYPTTATTQYVINGKSVTLDELRAAVSGKPELIVTVSHRVKTGELVKITADLPASAQPVR
jgi:hypothetical protein